VEAGDGVGGRHDGPDGRWRVGAGCSEGGAAGCGKGFVSLSLKENKKLKQKTKKTFELHSVLRIRDV
jgi:hypothetical protein